MNVVCIGEVLWDNLPHGMFLGGAPLNVATNLRKLGVDAQILSALGNDELGADTLLRLKALGFDTTHIQINDKPTGVVDVKLNASGVPKYVIAENAAWDFIEATDEALELVSKADYVVIGSLAFRNMENNEALLNLVKAVEGTLILDVNFRKPFYNKKLIDKLLGYADILKVNDEEIEEIAKWKFLSTEYTKSIPALCEMNKILMAFITLGEDGAAMYTDGSFTHKSRYEVTVADTVGAGDAFLAGALFSIIKGKEPKEVLKFANAMGAYVASKKGATPELDLNEIHRLLNN